MKRLALTFTVVPGSEPQVKKILSGYERPELHVDETTRLLRTSVFVGGNRVVRVVDIAGDLAAAMRHLASQPQIRAVESALNPYLEEPRDLADPTAARRFFARASLPRVGGTEQSLADDTSPGERYAVLCPVRTDKGEVVAELLSTRHGAGVPGGPSVASTVFRRGDVVVWMLEGAGQDTLLDAISLLGSTAEAGGLGGEKLANLLTVTDDLASRAGFTAFLAKHAMEQLTDRKAGARS
jgi:hypothetical protein